MWAERINVLIFLRQRDPTPKFNYSILYVEIKRPTRCNVLVSLLQNFLFVQHVSGTIMPIIRSSRVLQMVAACGTWRFGLQVVGLVWSCRLCVGFTGCWNIPQTEHICFNNPANRTLMFQHPENRTHNPQLHTRPTTCKPKRQVPQAATICITRAPDDGHNGAWNMLSEQ